MKVLRSVLILILILGASSVSAQKHKGVKFFEGSWEELLEKAKKENKPFFVDFYTSWCYPCKLLEKKTFTSEKVGEYANKYFIPYRLNAERGEGITIARKYGVTAYPTVLFFNPKGEVIGTHIGFVGPDQFLQVLKNYNIKSSPKGENKNKKIKTIPYNKVVLEKYQANLSEYKKK